MRALWIGLGALLALGCDDGGGGPEPGPLPDQGADLGDAAPPTPGACVPDDDLLAQQLPCNLDPDCPCGSHCSLGVCTVTCRSAADCEGGECTAFGRCEGQAGVDGVSPEGAPAVLGDVVFNRDQVDLLSTEQPVSVFVTPVDAPVRTLRITASAPFEVDCGDGAFQAECVADLSAVPAGTPLPLQVRTTQPRGMAPVRGDLTVHFTGRRRIVALLLPAVAPPEGFQRAGEYRGIARPVGAGLDARAADLALPEGLSALRVPVRAYLFADAEDPTRLPARFEDDFGALFPAPTVGLLQADNQGAWAGATEPHPFLAADGGAAPVAVGVRGDVTAAAWRGTALELSYRALFVGLTTARRAPYVQWQVSLTRVGDVPDDVGVPEPPAPPAELPDEAVQTALALEDPALAPGGDAVAQVAAAVCGTGFQASLTQDADGDYRPAGDLACAGPDATTGGLAFPLHTRSQLDLRADLAACAADLTAPDGDACLHRGRALTALAAALARDRDRALHDPGDGEPTAPDFTASALGHRLLQQWLGTHGFLAREAGRSLRLEAILNDGIAAGLTAREGLEASLRGWDLLLTPRVTAPLVVMPPEVLAEPDYRTRLYPAGVAGLDPDQPVRTQVQAIGLPVTLLDSLVTQLDAFTALVREAQAGLREFTEVEDLYGDLARRSLVVLALAHGLYTQARTLGAPPWQAEWDLARQAYGAAVTRSLTAVAALRAGANPLGIEDSDLPLYRVGDQVGPGDRFSALSDYLLGQPADARPIVPRLIERTREALTDVREAFVAARQRDIRQARLGIEQDRRLMEINRLYGEQIIGLCLDPDWVAFDILERWDQIDGDTCFLNQDAMPPCLPDAEQTAATVTSAEVAERICVAHRLRERVGEAASTGSADTDALVDAVGAKLRAEDGFANLQITALDWGDASLDDVTIDFTATLDAETSEHTIHLRRLRTLELNLPEDTPASLLPEAYRACDHRRAVVERIRPTDPDALCDLPDDCPVGMACYQGECSRGVVPRAGTRTECYRGALGEVALALELARGDVRLARAELDDMIAAHDVAMQGCAIIAGAFDATQSLSMAHRATMGRMADAKLAANLALIALEAAQQASGIFSGSSINLGAAIGTLTAIPKSAIAVLDREMGRAQSAFEAAKAVIEGTAEIAQCVNDAAVHMVGAQTAALKIEQATLEFTRQLVEFNNLKVTLDGLLLEGHLSLEAERARTLSPLNTDFWIGEHFDRYERTLRLAKRGLYLSLLAAEYEFQASLPYRADVLRATHPIQLEQVLDDLRNQVVTGTVNGASPTDLVQVVSLRQHLLQVSDRSALGAGWHQLDPAERFGRWLAAPQFAVYGRDGQYLGQEIPFNIMPATASAAGPVDVPLLTGTDCAERLWSINASVLGDGASTGESTLARLVVRKRNTFHSQRCGGDPGELQTASTRPSRNLFLDPLAYDASPDAPGAVGEDTGFTAARIQARLGVARAELEDERYGQGASEELAGRGLYGDYALFLPAESLARDGRDGLVLAGIEDVLLRLDYVSVAGGR